MEQEIFIGQQFDYLTVIAPYVEEEIEMASIEDGEGELPSNEVETSPDDVVPEETPEEELPTEPLVKLWICKCVCGNTTVVGDKQLKSGNIKSCGCTENKTYLTPVGSTIRDGKKYINCRCICGKNITISENEYMGNLVHSCGCLNTYHERKLLDMEYMFKKLKVK